MTPSVGHRAQGGTRYNIRVLDRAIRMLSLLADGKPRTVGEISEDLGLSPSTTFRLLATLGQHHYVQKDESTNVYGLGLACLELAHAYQDSHDLRKVALPVLEALRDDVKETIHLAVVDQMEVVYIEKLSGLHAIGLMGSRVGRRSPAYCTGLGKVLLAYLPAEQLDRYLVTTPLQQHTPNTITAREELIRHLRTVREQGYAIDYEEHEPGVACVAAPVFDHSGVVAAISVSGPVARVREQIAIALHGAHAESIHRASRTRRPAQGSWQASFASRGSTPSAALSTRPCLTDFGSAILCSQRKGSDDRGTR